MKTILIKLSDIVIDAGTQQREKISDDVVAEYAEAITCGTKFPAVTTFFNGAEHILVDGFHRYWAHKNLGILEIESDVHEGSKREAILFSAGVNGTHGIRPTNADKRKSVFMLLNDAEWSKWSNRDIAKHCKVGHSFVDKLRKEITKRLPTVGSYDSKPASNLESDKKLSTGNQSENDNSESEEHGYDEKEQTILELKDAVTEINEENIRLKDAIATNQLPEDEIQSAAEIIADLRHQVKALEAELNAVKSSRDVYLRENEQLKNQCAMQRKQLQKLGA